MSEDPTIPLLDHELEADELAWMKAVYDDFIALRVAFARGGQPFDPKAALREVLSREEHKLAHEADLSGFWPLASRPESPWPWCGCGVSVAL